MTGWRDRRTAVARLLDVALMAAVLILGVQYVRARYPRSEVLSRSEWRELLSDTPANPAGHTLVEFIDYQCPVCAALEGVLDSIETHSQGRLRRVLRHFPLPANRFAFGAASAAICAAAQGKQRTMHKVLLQRQADFDSVSFVALAGESGVGDTSRFRHCMTSDSVRLVIEADVSLGRKLHLRGTPTFVLEREVSVGLAPDAFTEFVRTRTQKSRGPS